MVSVAEELVVLVVVLVIVFFWEFFFSPDEEISLSNARWSVCLVCFFVSPEENKRFAVKRDFRRRIRTRNRTAFWEDYTSGTSCCKCVWCFC